MPRIDIENNYTTQDDIEKCITAFKDIQRDKNIPKEITIEFINHVEEIDILFFAYLILFKIQELKLKITINFSKFQIYENKTSFKFKMIQYINYSYLATGHDFIKFYHQNIEEDKWEIIEDHRGVKLISFSDSNSFLPFISVSGNDPDSFENIFSKSISKLYSFNLNVLNKSVEESINNNKLFNSIRESIISNINANDYSSCFFDLGKIAFYKCLSLVKVLNVYFDKNYFDKNIQNSKIDSEQFKGVEVYALYEILKPVILELEKFPIIYHLIFAIVLSSVKNSDLYKKSSIEEFKNYTINLWEFSKTLIRGLTEIVKNIKEHANPSFGIITVRIYEESVLKELKKNNFDVEEIFINNIKELKNIKAGNLSFLELNVIDAGEFGVINTMLRRSEKLSLSNYFTEPKNLEFNSHFKEYITKDVEALKLGKIVLRNFLDPKLGISLNQQLKRATAHLGLLIFSKLIEHNWGMLKASSWLKDAKDYNRDNVLIPQSIFGNNIKSDGIKYGTNYRVVLPIIIKEFYKTPLPHFTEIPHEYAESEIKGIEKIFSYEYLNLIPGELIEILDPSKTYLYSFQPQIEKVETKDDEEKLFSQVFEVIDDNNSIFVNKNIIFCLNLQTTYLDGSKLFRFLGNWELNFSNIELIIYNLHTSILLELNSINKDFLKKITDNKIEINNALDYWNEHSIILTYTFVEVDGKKFYFTDALSGKNEKDFININKIIKRTNFNSTITINKKNEKSEPKKIKNYHVLNKHSVSHQSALIPYDLILKSNDDVTLFEHNSKVILENELKIKND